MEEDKTIEELKERIQKLEKAKEISNLKERLEKLEGKQQKQPIQRNMNQVSGNSLSYKPLEQNLGEGIKELGSSIGNIPHIVIPDRKPKNEPNMEVFNEKEKKVIHNFRKWALIIGVLVIVGYAAYTILKGWIF